MIHEIHEAKAASLFSQYNDSRQPVKNQTKRQQNGDHRAWVETGESSVKRGLGGPLVGGKRP
jgi:hypothetical protein